MKNKKERKLVIVGDSAFAQIAYEYFTWDSTYQVVAFCVDRAFITRDTLLGLPVVAMEDVASIYPVADHDFYAALVYTQLNRLRTRMFLSMKEKGYRPATYVSSRAFVWPNVSIGEHCFIFENNTLQPFTSVGRNVVLWSGNHIGHHSSIGNHTFVSSHVVVSGFCSIGESCFLGVNSTLANNLSIGDDCLVGAGCLVTRDVPENSIVKGTRSMPAHGARRRFLLDA
jgi:sugar O-acyltransferase (sialic acid O-acetyltransferase NeuD family)